MNRSHDKASKDLTKHWDERLLADQWAAVLLWLRKLLRDPCFINHAMNHFEEGAKEHAEDMHTMLSLFQGEDPIEIVPSKDIRAANMKRQLCLQLKMPRKMLWR